MQPYPWPNVKRKQSLISVILLNRDISLNSPWKKKKKSLCYLPGYDCIMQSSVNSHANCAIESIVTNIYENTFTVNEYQMNVLFFFWWFWINRYVNVFLERSLHANEGHIVSSAAVVWVVTQRFSSVTTEIKAAEETSSIVVNESLLTKMKEIGTQMNVYFL